MQGPKSRTVLAIRKAGPLPGEARAFSSPLDPGQLSALAGVISSSCLWPKTPAPMCLHTVTFLFHVHLWSTCTLKCSRGNTVSFSWAEMVPMSRLYGYVSITMVIRQEKIFSDNSTTGHSVYNTGHSLLKSPKDVTISSSFFWEYTRCFT